MTLLAVETYFVVNTKGLRIGMKVHLEEHRLMALHLSIQIKSGKLYNIVWSLPHRQKSEYGP